MTPSSDRDAMGEESPPDVRTKLRTRQRVTSLVYLGVLAVAALTFFDLPFEAIPPVVAVGVLVAVLGAIFWAHRYARTCPHCRKPWELTPRGAPEPSHCVHCAARLRE